MDKLTWFKFTPSDWMMGKIQRCSVETRGMFMNLCCLYWNKECDLSVEDAEIEVDEKPFKEMVKKKVVSIDGDNIRISFLDEQMEEILETSEKRRDAANKRWAKKNAKAMQVHASALQNDADKSKSKKREEGEKDLEKNKEEVNTHPDSVEQDTTKPFQAKRFLKSLGLDDKLADEYMAVRKLKRLKNTETAFEALKTEIEKTGVSPPEIIKLCVVNSWGGFKASWDGWQHLKSGSADPSKDRRQLEEEFFQLAESEGWDHDRTGIEFEKRFNNAE